MINLTSLLPALLGILMSLMPLLLQGADSPSSGQFGPEFPAIAETGRYVVTASDWDQPRTGERIVQIPAINAAVKHYDRVPDARMFIRYPGGDDGTLMAYELKSWLITLGLASDRIVLEKGLGQADRVILEVKKENRL